MTCPRRAIAPFACLLVASAVGAAQSARADEADMHDDHTALAAEEALGTVDFRVSCAEAIRPAFDRALSLMHHMMYEQARSEFQQIAEAEPDCAMAYRHDAVPAALVEPPGCR